MNPTHDHIAHPVDSVTSHGPGGAHGHAQVAQQEDRPNVRAIFFVGVLGIAITVMSVYISWGFQLHAEHQINAAPVPAAVPGTYEAKPEISAGILERGMLNERAQDVADGAAQQLRRDKDSQLATYGWTDRSRSLIHIPMNQAMDQIIQGYGQRR